jgi:hypothetical protein
MRSVARIFSFVVILIALTGCQTAKNQGPTPGDLISGYASGDVSVEISEGYRKNILSLEPDRIELLTNGLQQQLRSDLVETLPNVMKGTKPAKINVLLNTISPHIPDGLTELA